MNDQSGRSPALIAEALKTAAVKSIYEEVSASTPIAIETGSEGNWSSVTENGKTVITVTPTEHPGSALMHELLHAKLKISGYRQYLTIVSMDDKRDALLGIATILDNELQHHRMYKAYAEAGLDPELFYHDDDVGAFEYVRSELKRLRKDAPPEDFFRLFVTVIAPGGAGSDGGRRELKELFQKKCRAKTWNMLVRIEQAFEQWANSDTLDAGPTIMRILRILGEYRKSWVGFSADRLCDGLFVGPKFTEEDAQAWRAKRAEKQ